ncbi:MAG: murein biosynthesis integral membrane protein MurJ [Kordiimonas sp.]|nr:murein biosynthesis integral membrane protein MurJ [Kordiimonas sp.]
MSILRAAATVGSLTMVSRLLGFVRDILMASILGAGWVADCFFIAFKLPNFFRRLFAEGAFNAAFVPLFAESVEKDGREEALRFAEEVFAALLCVLLLFVFFMQIIMPWAMVVLAPGFMDEPEKYDLAVLLTRLTFPYLLFISLVSLLAGVLNAFEKFAAAAMAPILLNISMIATLLFAHDLLETPAHSLAIAVSMAGGLQFAWLYRSCERYGLFIRLRLPQLTPRVKKMLRLMLPAALGAGVVQVNLMFDIILASFLPAGSLSYLFYADRLNQLPLGVIGVAIGTVLLPLLSRQVANGDGADVWHSQNRAIELALFLTLPAAIALMVVPGPIIQVLFERGAFSSADSMKTSWALMAYAAGLPAYVLAKVFTPGYFARQDTKTPVKFAVIALIANMIFNVILMIPFDHVGLAMATALSAWLNVILLVGGLVRRGHYQTDTRLYQRLWRMSGATLLMAAAIAAINHYWLAAFWGGDLGQKTAGLVVLVVTGIAVYAITAIGSGAMTIADLRKFKRRS